jgi:hypothetical protein
MEKPGTERKCEVPTCPRHFIPGKTGASGRCSRCLMRKRRGLPEITATEAHLAESRVAGEVEPRSRRVIGYIRPALGVALLAHLKGGGSESDVVNLALAIFLEREDLA